MGQIPHLLYLFNFVELNNHQDIIWPPGQFSEMMRMRIITKITIITTIRIITTIMMIMDNHDNDDHDDDPPLSASLGR